MKILRGTLVLVSGSFFAMFLGAIAGLIIARILGPEQYGIYTAGFALPGALSLSFLLGIDGILTREIAKKPDRASELLISSLYPILAWICFLSFLILFVGKVLGYTTTIYSVLIIGIVVFALRSVAVLYRTVVRGMERMTLDVLIQLSENVSCIILVPLIFIVSPSAESAAIVTAIAALVSVVVGSIMARKLFFYRNLFNFKLSRELVISAFPLLIMITLLGLNFRVETLALTLLSSERQVGLYGAACGILLISRPISISFSASLLPRLSISNINQPEEFKVIWEKGLRYIVIISIILGVIFSLYAPLLISLLYGQGFIEGVSALRVLGLTTSLLSINTFLWNVLISINKQKLVAITAFFGLIVTILFSIILVPISGSIGAAWSTVGREFCQLVLLAWFLRDKVHTINIKKVILIPIVSGVILLAGLWLIKDTENILAVGILPIAIGLSLIFLLLTQSVERDELKLFLSSLTFLKTHKST